MRNEARIVSARGRLSVIMLVFVSAALSSCATRSRDDFHERAQHALSIHMPIESTSITIEPVDLANRGYSWLERTHWVELGLLITGPDDVCSKIADVCQRSIADQPDQILLFNGVDHRRVAALSLQQRIPDNMVVFTTYTKNLDRFPIIERNGNIVRLLVPCSVYVEQPLDLGEYIVDLDDDAPKDTNRPYSFQDREIRVIPRKLRLD